MFTESATPIEETLAMENMTTIPKGRIVDLTHTLLPFKEQYTLEVSQRDDRTGPEGDIMKTVYMWSHVGTHVEAPLHFLSDGGDTASLPITKLMGPAIVLDFQGKGISEPITLEEIKTAGEIQVGDRVLMMTGRHNLYRTPQSHDRPYITEEAMRWLVEDRKINCLGTDSSGFEVRGVDHHPNHRILNNAAIPVIECLTNLVELRKQRIFLIALPWPVVNLDACPVRAIAIEPED
jgi:arylformamidase